MVAERTSTIERSAVPAAPDSTPTTDGRAWHAREPRDLTVVLAHAYQGQNPFVFRCGAHGVIVRDGPDRPGRRLATIGA
jgi:hypothetical protein